MSKHTHARLLCRYVRLALDWSEMEIFAHCKVPRVAKGVQLYILLNCTFTLNSKVRRLEEKCSHYPSVGSRAAATARVLLSSHTHTHSRLPSRSRARIFDRPET